jgi:hypothetical protein
MPPIDSKRRKTYARVSSQVRMWSSSLDCTPKAGVTGRNPAGAPIHTVVKNRRPERRPDPAPIPLLPPRVGASRSKDPFLSRHEREQVIARLTYGAKGCCPQSAECSKSGVSVTLTRSVPSDSAV